MSNIVQIFRNIWCFFCSYLCEFVATQVYHGQARSPTQLRVFFLLAIEEQSKLNHSVDTKQSVEDHSSRRTKYDYNVSVIFQEVDQKGIASLNIFLSANVTSFSKELPNDASRIAPHLLHQRATRDFVFCRLHN